MQKWNITLVTSSPLYPRSNGLAEKDVSVVKNLLKNCQEQGTDINSALLSYRNTPVSGLHYTPSQLLMSRLLNTKIPVKTSLLRPKTIDNAKEILKQHQVRYKTLHDRRIRKEKEFMCNPGDNVVVQRGRIWEPAKVIQAHANPRSFLVRTENNRIIRRNSTHLRQSVLEPTFKIPVNEDAIGNSNTESTDSYTSKSKENLQEASKVRNNIIEHENKNNHYVTKSGRIVKPPDRFTYNNKS